MKKIVLHIGANKTGTTSIQNFFSEQEVELREKHGVLYPVAGRVWNAHFKLAWAVGAGKVIDGQEREWVKLRDEIEASTCNTFVLSSENFILVKDPKSIRFIRDLFPDYEFQIVLYARRQDYWLESLFLQRIKMGFLEKTFLEFLAQPDQELDYEKILFPWNDVFGSESISVIDFDSEAKKKGSVRAFFDIINVVDVKVLEKRDNDSLDRNLAEFLMSRKVYLSKSDRQKKIIEIYASKIRPNLEAKGSKYFFSSVERRKYIGRYLKGNNNVAMRFTPKKEMFDMTSMPTGALTVDKGEVNILSNKLFFELLDEAKDSATE